MKQLLNPLVARCVSYLHDCTVFGSIAKRYPLQFWLRNLQGEINAQNGARKIIKTSPRQFFANYLKTEGVDPRDKTIVLVMLALTEEEFFYFMFRDGLPLCAYGSYKHNECYRYFEFVVDLHKWRPVAVTDPRLN